MISSFIHTVSLSHQIQSGYLGHINRRLHRPYPKQDIEDKIDPKLLKYPQEKKAAATKALLQVYDNLIPRWKGVVLTAEAEVEAQAQDQEDQQDDKHVLPWANIKFTTTAPVAKEDAKAEFAKLDEYINSKGERMSLEELAQYKYHIDLGGGGGTTWSGTIEKLALPGLLFHHRCLPRITCTIISSLGSITFQYQKTCKNAGTDFMRELGIPQGFRKVV